MSNPEHALAKHWRRLAALLSAEQIEELKQAMAEDLRQDRRRSKLRKMRQQLPILRRAQEQARLDRKWEYADRLQMQIRYRERVLAEAAEEGL